MAAHIEKKNLKIMSNSVEVGAERRMCKGRGKQQKQSQGTEKLNRDFSWVRREYSLCWDKAKHDKHHHNLL